MREKGVCAREICNLVRITISLLTIPSHCLNYFLGLPFLKFLVYDSHFTVSLHVSYFWGVYTGHSRQYLVGNLDTEFPSRLEACCCCLPDYLFSDLAGIYSTVEKSPSLQCESSNVAPLGAQTWACKQSPLDDTCFSC